MGIDIFVGRGVGPVSAVLDYMVTCGPLPGQLFMFQDGHHLTHALFVARVREALLAVGVDADLYSGHSFRSGAATTATARGIGDAMIQLLGRWRSDAYKVRLLVRPWRASRPGW